MVFTMSKTDSPSSQLSSVLQQMDKQASNLPIASPDLVVEYIKLDGIPGRETLAESILEGISNVTAVEFDMSIDEAAIAVDTVFKLRICQLRGAKVPINWMDVEYPAVLLPILAAIGDIRIDDLAIDLRVISDDVESSNGKWRSTLEFDKWEVRYKHLSKLTSKARTCGLDIAVGLPRERKGNLSVVTMTHVNDELKSYRRPEKITPADRLISSAMEFNIHDYAIFGTARWNYGTVNYHHRALRNFVLGAFR